MHRLTLAFLAGMLLLLPVLLGGSPPGLRPGPYILEDSRFEEGCYDPCMCPIMSRDDVEGGFTLAPIETTDGFMSFAVNDVVWIVGDSEKIVFRGSGTYRISLGVESWHEMTLDLSRNNEPAEQFTSGLVLAGHAFEGIDIAVSKNGFYCYDTGLMIRARHSEHPISWGGIKSLFVTN